MGRSRWQLIQVLVVAVFATLSVGVAAPPAAEAAAGGTATAQAVDIHLAAVSPVFGGITLVGPTATAPATNGTVNANGIGVAAGVTIGAITNTATRDPLSTSASSTIASASVDLGINGVPPVVQSGALTANVTCPFGGGGPAEALSTDVSLLGVPVVVTSGGEVQTFVLQGVTVRATIREVEDDTGPLRAVAIEVDVAVGVGALPPENIGTIVLAAAACETPTAPDGPTAASLAPPAGSTGGGTVVTVTGTNFIPGQTSVTIGATTVPAASVAVNSSSTSLTFNTPPGAAGAADVTVTTPGGTSAPPLTFTYVAPPTATGLTPNGGPAPGGTAVTVAGGGFIDGATSVTIGGITVPPGTVTVNDPTSLTFLTPPHATGPVDVTVTTVGGTSAPALTFTYVAPPTITVLDPDFGPTTGGTSVNVTGSGFVIGQTSVTIFGIVIPPAEVDVTDPGNLTFTTPPVGNRGPVDVTVTVPVAGASQPAAFFYFDPPTVSSIDPPAGPVAGGNSVVVTGTGFVAGSTSIIVHDPANFDHLVAAGNVTINGDGTTATFLMPASTGLTPGPATVLVDSPGGRSPTLAYEYVPVPTATGLSPDEGPQSGGPAGRLVITGTNFIDGATDVEFAGIPATNVVVGNGGTTVSADPPAADTPGPVEVVVTTPGGETAPLTYTYLAAPTASDITPTAGPISGGTPVTITGTDFVVGETDVEFDGVPATDVVVDPNGLSLMAVTPAGDVGPAAVIVTTPGGETDPLTFTYFDVPTASEISPDSGPLSGGPAGRVVIEGTNLVPGETIVLFDDVAATNVVVAPDGLSLGADPPAHDAGPVAVVVDTPGGETEPLGYTYVPAPTAATIAPAQGPTSGGTPVTITGTNFLDGETSVEFDGITATDVVVAADGLSLTAMTPADDAGAAAVTVTTPGGESDPPLTFTYVAPPGVGSVTPPSGPLAGGNTVTVSGSAFVPGATSVTVHPPGGGAPVTILASAVTVSPDGTTASFVAPASTAAGDATITLTNPFGTSPGVVYEYLPVPTAAALQPDAVGTTAGGDVVTIVGTGFVPGQTTVQIGPNTIPASQVSVVTGGQTPLTGALTQALQTSLVQPLTATGTTLTFTTPANASGAVSVTVTTPGGTSTPALTYTYVAPPTATSLSPTSGPASGGTIITITGSGFIPGATMVIVTLPNGQVVTIPAAELGIGEGGTALSMSAPRSAVAGAAAIRVVTAGGETAPLTFTYTRPGRVPVPVLPATGSDGTSLIAAAVVLLVLGGALAGASRRRNRRGLRS